MATPTCSKFPLHSVARMALALGGVGLSLGLNQVLFVGTFFGWCGYGVLCVLSLTLAAWRAASGAAVLPGILALAVLVSPFALPYSFGVLLFAVSFVLARDAALGGAANAGKFAAALAGGWCVVALVRWYLISVRPEWAAHETAIRLAGENWLPAFTWPRMAMPIGHANYTSGIGLLLLPLFAGLAWEAKNSRALRGAWLLFALVAGVLLVAGGSRAAILALPLAFAAWVALAPSALISWKRKLTFAACGFAMMVCAVALKPSILERFTKPDANVYSDLIRRDYALGCWRMFCEKPLTGWGAGALPEQFAPFNPSDGGKAACYHAHSTPFQWLAEFGVWGGVLFLAVAILSVGALVRSSRSSAKVSAGQVGIAVSASAYLLFSFFDYQANIPALGLLWGGVLGAACARLRGDGATRRETPRFRLPGLIFAGAALILAGRVITEVPARFDLWKASGVLSDDANAAARHMTDAIAAAPERAALHGYAALVFTAAAKDKPEGTRAAIAELVSQEWRRAAEVAPNYPPIRVYGAFSLADRNREAAKDAFKTALRADPKSSLAWRGLAECYARLGKAEAAAQTLALGCFVRPELALDPLLARGVFGVTPDIVLGRFDELIVSYDQARPEDARARANLACARERLRLWWACRAVPLKFLLKDKAAPDSPARKLLLRRLSGNLERESARRAIAAVVFASQQLEIDSAQADILLDQFVGASTSPFSGPRTVNTPESLLHFGSYLGCSDLAELSPPIFLRDDLWVPVLFSDALNPIRADRDFLLRRLETLP